MNKTKEIYYMTKKEWENHENTTFPKLGNPIKDGGVCINIQWNKGDPSTDEYYVECICTFAYPDVIERMIIDKLNNIENQLEQSRESIFSGHRLQIIEESFLADNGRKYVKENHADKSNEEKEKIFQEWILRNRK